MAADNRRPSNRRRRIWLRRKARLRLCSDEVGSTTQRPVDPPPEGAMRSRPFLNRSAVVEGAVWRARIAAGRKTPIQASPSKTKNQKVKAPVPG